MRSNVPWTDEEPAGRKAPAQLKEPRVSEGKAAKTLQSRLLKGKRVVIAEDQGVTQLQLRKILNAEGLNVVGAAANGQEALDLVMEHKPDIILMDVRMPIMDGLEASRRILEQMHVCIIMLTAYSDEDYRRRAREIGITNYVLKPVSSETLMPQITAAVERVFD